MSGININSEAWCRKAYLNYHCYENSMGLSARDMAQITQKWQDRISSWQNSVSSDENEYDFDDSEYANYKESGEAAAREETDDYDRKDGDNAKSIGMMVGTGVTGVGMGLVATAIALAGKAGGTWCFKPLAWAIAAAELALSLSYWVIKPNKDGKEAADEMNNVLANAQGTLAETQDEMATMSEELITLSDEANEMNEATNEDMKEDGTEFNMYKTSLEKLQAKIESGQPLTKEEQAFYKELVKILGEIGVNIAETSEENTDAVEEIYGNMETYQEGYDYAAETMGEVEGMTDYARSFDVATRDQANVLGGLMIANAAASGTVAGFLFADMNIFTKPISAVFGGMAAAATISNGFAAADQFSIAKDVGNEIDTRKVTQELNTATNEIYTEEIDAYDGLMTGVEELEMEIPEDTEVPEAVAVPAGGASATGTTGGAATGGSTDGTGGADDRKKKSEE